MAKYIIDEATLTGLGDAIRDVTGETETYTPEEMTTKVRSMQMSAGGTVDIPVFDLGAMGLTAVPVTGGSEMLALDTTEIWTALTKGAVTFVMPFVGLDGVTVNMSSTMHGSTDGVDIFLCTATAYLEDILFLSINVYQEGAVMATVTTLTGSIGAYIDEALGGEY